MASGSFPTRLQAATARWGAELAPDLRHYSVRGLRRDLLAGLTVAVVAVPQSMAYAIVAGVPVQYGLYTVIVQCLVGAMLNSQPLLSGGPINTQSLLVASIVTRLVAPANVEYYVQLVFALALLKGLMQLGMAALRVGSLARYVSQSVIVGFTAGAGVLIAAGQLHWLLGFSVGRVAGDWPGLVGDVQRLLRGIDQTLWLSVGVGAIALTVMMIARRISPLAPGPLAAVAGSAALVTVAGWSADNLPLVQPLPPASELLSLLHVPWVRFEDAEHLLGGAAALAFLGLMEAFSIGKTLAGRRGESVSANRELLAQGLTNAVSSFFQCIPGSSSFSRSALNHQAGACSRLSSLFNGLFVAAIFVLLAPLARFIPMAALAAILLVVACGLIDWRAALRMARADRSDFLVCLATFVATLVLPLHHAIFLGIFLNLALQLRQASRLHITQVVPQADGHFAERPLDQPQPDHGIVFVQVEGDLFFGVADDLARQLAPLNQAGLKAVILRLKRTHSIDSTVMAVLEQFVRGIHARGGHVLLCGVRPELMRAMRHFGLVDLIGTDNVLPAGRGILTSARQALARAQELVGADAANPPVPLTDAFGAWTYEI